MKKIASKIADKAISSAVDAVTLSSEQRDRLIDALPTHRAWIPQPHRCELGYAAPSFECDAILADRTVGKIRSCDYYATPEVGEDSKGKDAHGDRNKADNMWVLLLFYPADFSFICATELLALSGAAERFRRECNCQVMACSTDTVYAHRAWCSLPRARGGLSLNDGSERRFEQPLGFPLLADVSRAVSRDFGVLFPAGSEHAGMAMCGTFLIDPNGLVRHMAVQEMSIARSVPELLRLVHGCVRHAATGELLPHGWRIGTPGVRTKEMSEVGQTTSDSIAQSKLHQQVTEARQSEEAAQHPSFFSKLTHAIFGGNDDDAAAAASAAEVSGAEATRAIEAAQKDAKERDDHQHGNAAKVKGPMDAANRAKEGSQIHDMISSLDLKHTPNLGPKAQTLPPPPSGASHHIETLNASATLRHHSPAPHALSPPQPHDVKTDAAAASAAKQPQQQQKQQAPPAAGAGAPTSPASLINISPHAIRKTDDAAKAHLSLAGGPTLKGVALTRNAGTAGLAATAPAAAAAAAAPTARASSQEAPMRPPVGAYGYPGAAAPAATAANASRRRAASADPSVNHITTSLTNAAILDYDDVGAGGPYFSAMRQHQHVVEAAPPTVDDNAAPLPPLAAAGRTTAAASSELQHPRQQQQAKNQPPTSGAAWTKVETEVPAAFGGLNLQKKAATTTATNQAGDKNLDVEVWRSGSGAWAGQEGAGPADAHQQRDNAAPVRVAAMSSDPAVRDEIDRHTHHA